MPTAVTKLGAALVAATLSFTAPIHAEPREGSVENASQLPSAQWLGAYAAMRVLNEQGEMRMSEEQFGEAAGLFHRASKFGEEVPSDTHYFVTFKASIAYASDGQGDEALTMLEKLAKDGARWGPIVANMGAFKDLADTKRFKAVLARMEDNLERFRSAHSDPDKAPLIFDDVERFWTAYDLAKETESPSRKAAIFRRHYLAPASPGLIDYTWLKTDSSEKLVERISEISGFYDGIRAQTLRAKSFEPQIREGLHKVKALFPEAYFPPVTFVIGRLNSGGTAGPEGMLIGLDVWSWTEGVPLEGISEGFQNILTNFNLDRLPFVVIHEQVHALQTYGDNRTLLRQVLQEGSADFIAGLALPDDPPTTYYEWGLKNEERVWKRLQDEMNGTDASDWIGNNSAEIAEDWHADLGYFIGARICEAYYAKAKDKQQAIRDLLSVTDPFAILEASGYGTQFTD